MKSIKALIFDFGGVMTTCSMPVRVRAITDELGLPWDEVTKGFGKYRLDYDRGKITIKEFYDRVWQDAGLEVSDEDRRRIEEADSASWLYRNERTLAWMKQLKKAGYRIGVLTNMPPAFVPLFREHFADFLELADAIVISGEEGVVKPDPAIYALVQSRLGLNAEELLFIDDLEKNCQAARDCGWQALRFEANDQVETAFANWENKR